MDPNTNKNETYGQKKIYHRSRRKEKKIQTRKSEFQKRKQAKKKTEKS